MRVQASMPEADPSTVERFLAESDGIRARLAASGVDDASGYVRSRLESLMPSDADLRRYYDEHRAMFGSRGFDESKEAIDRLVRIQMLRAELGTSGSSER